VHLDLPNSPNRISEVGRLSSILSLSTITFAYGLKDKLQELATCRFHTHTAKAHTHSTHKGNYASNRKWGRVCRRQITSALDENIPLALHLAIALFYQNSSKNIQQPAKILQLIYITQKAYKPLHYHPNLLKEKPKAECPSRVGDFPLFGKGKELKECKNLLLIYRL